MHNSKSTTIGITVRYLSKNSIEEQKQKQSKPCKDEEDGIKLDMIISSNLRSRHSGCISRWSWKRTTTKKSIMLRNLPRSPRLVAITSTRICISIRVVKRYKTQVIDQLLVLDKPTTSSPLEKQNIL